MVVDEGPVDKSASPGGQSRARPFPRDVPDYPNGDELARDRTLVGRRWDVNWRMIDSSAIEDIGTAAELTISNDEELARFLQSAGQTQRYLRLRRLTVKGCTVDLTALCAAAPYVQALTLDKNSDIAVTRQFWEHLRSLTIIAAPVRLDMTALLSQGWPALKKLVVQNVELDLDVLRRSVPLLKHLTARSTRIMAGFSGSMAHLITLRIDNCTGFHSEMITREEWPALTRLEFVMCRANLEAIREKTPQLRTLSLDHFNGIETFRQPWAHLHTLIVRNPQAGSDVGVLLNRECLWPSLITLTVVSAELDLNVLNTATPRLKNLTATNTFIVDGFSRPMARLVSLRTNGSLTFRTEMMTQGVWPSLRTLDFSVNSNNIPPTLFLPNAPALRVLNATTSGIGGRPLSIDISQFEWLESLHVTCTTGRERLNLLCGRDGGVTTHSHLKDLNIWCNEAVVSLGEARMPQLKTAMIQCHSLADYQALMHSVDTLQSFELYCRAVGQLPRDIQPVTDLTLMPRFGEGGVFGEINGVKQFTIQMDQGGDLDLRQLAGVPKINVLGRDTSVTHIGALTGTETLVMTGVTVSDRLDGVGPKFMLLSSVNVRYGRIRLSALEEVVFEGRSEDVFDLRGCPRLRRLDLPKPALMREMWDAVQHVPEINYADLHIRDGRIVGAGLPPKITWSGR